MNKDIKILHLNLFKKYFDEIIIDGNWDKLENKEDEQAQLRQAEKIICEKYNLSKREFTEMKNKIFF